MDNNQNVPNNMETSNQNPSTSNNQNLNLSQTNNIQFQQMAQQQVNNIQTQSSMNNIQQVQPIEQNQQSNQFVQQVGNSNFKNPKKGNKKILLIIVLAIICLGIGAFFYFKNTGSSGIKGTENLSLIFDPDKPIVIQKDSKYGYIDSNGKIIIEPTFLSASSFVGDYAVVKASNTENNAYKDYVYQIINKSGNVLLTSTGYTTPEYYSEYGIWVVDEHLYNSKLQMITDENLKVDYSSKGFLSYQDYENSESGIINYKGKKVFTWAGTSAFITISDTDYDTDDLYATVTSYSDPEREVIVSLKSGEILFTSPDKDNYYVTSSDDGIFYYYQKGKSSEKKYLYFHNGKLEYESTENLYDMELYDYQNQILELDYGYDYDEIGKSQRRYYYDIKNKKILDEKPTSSTDIDLDEIDIMLSNYGYKELESSGKYGIMTEDKIIVPAEYDDIEFLNLSLYKYMKQEKNQELVLLEKDKKTLLMNIKNQKVLATFDSSYVYDDDDSTFLKATLYDADGYTTKGYIIYNLLTGESITVDKSDNCYIYSNYITMNKDNKKIYYNTKLEKIYEEEL